MKNFKKHVPWILWGLLVSFVAAVALTFLYGVFRDYAKMWQSDAYESTNNVEWLYQSSYVLYHDLYNSQNDARLDYAGLYLKPDEGYELLLDSEKLAELMQEREASEDPEDGDKLSENSDPEGSDGYDNGGGTSGRESLENILADENLVSDIQNEILSLEAYFDSLEGNYVNLNSLYSYCIRDDVTGKYLTNMSEERVERLLEKDYSEYSFLLTFRFDGAGNVSVGDVQSQKEETVRKNANAAARDMAAYHQAVDLTAFSRYGSMTRPKDCTVIYGVAAVEEGTNTNSGFYVDTSQRSGYNTFTVRPYAGENYTLEAYSGAEITNTLLLFLFVMMLAGMFLPMPMKTKPWNEMKLYAPCLEGLLLVAVLLLAFSESVLVEHVAFVASGEAQKAIAEYFAISDYEAYFLQLVYNLAFLTCVFFLGWYIGVCCRAVREKGIRGYIREKSVIYRFFPFIKGKVLGAYQALEHLDLTRNAHKAIIKIVICNGIILFFISSLWFGGFMVTIVYSLLLYFILRKYISNLQKKYSILLKATNEMAAGNLNVSIQEDIGVFEPFKPELAKIQEGFRKAVAEEVKSQKLKAELITNVSHDLKTPLTAIITYVNLLKEENVTEEQRREYLKVLEQKSLRLKALIEDLFEVSKANSQNITLNLAEVDIINLVKQVAFEVSDKMQAANLDLRMNLTDEKVLISLDSQKTYRIYENLFGNIVKYAMGGTRVYVNGFRIDDTVVITLKNISAGELTVDSADLTERFVRGDASRNTEGSGLGLAIAKSFTELQGGVLTLEVDGDLFKVTTTWHVGERAT